MLPLVGDVAAGTGLVADQQVEDMVAVPDQLCADADFLLTVKGESMINAGILPGDFVVVRKQDDARNGEIVVALVGDEDATVKRFFRESRPRSAAARERRDGAHVPRAGSHPGHRQGGAAKAMTGALTVGEAFGPTLDEVILAALSGARRPARSAVCPVCGGTMRRLAEAAAAVPVGELADLWRVRQLDRGWARAGFGPASPGRLNSRQPGGMPATMRR